MLFISYLSIYIWSILKGFSSFLFACDVLGLDHDMDPKGQLWHHFFTPTDVNYKTSIKWGFLQCRIHIQPPGGDLHFLSPHPFYFQKAPSLLIRAPSWQTTLWLTQMTVAPDGQSRHSPGSTVKTASQTRRSPRAPSPRPPPAQQRPEHRHLAAQKFPPSTQECGNIRHSEVRGERKHFSAFTVKYFRWAFILEWSQNVFCGDGDSRL